MVPDNLETLLTRDATASALTSVGFPISAATLATRATRGGGPKYRKFGQRPLYRWGDSLEWAKGRLSKPVTNSSELEAT